MKWLYNCESSFSAAGITVYHVWLPPVNGSYTYQQPLIDQFYQAMVSRGWNIVGQSVVYNPMTDYLDDRHLNEVGNLLLLTHILADTQ